MWFGFKMGTMERRKEIKASSPVCCIESADESALSFRLRTVFLDVKNYIDGVGANLFLGNIHYSVFGKFLIFIEDYCVHVDSPKQEITLDMGLWSLLGRLLVASS